MILGDAVRFRQQLRGEKGAGNPHRSEGTTFSRVPASRGFLINRNELRRRNLPAEDAAVALVEIVEVVAEECVG